MCIINNSKKFIFIHIPKTAGTSVALFFSRYSRYCDLEIGATQLGEAIQPEFLKRFKIWKHSTAQEIKSVVGDAIFEEYKTFTFVRNPYDRLFSTYKFLKTWPHWPGHEKFVQFQTYQQFIESGWWTGKVKPDRMFRRQISWIRESSRGPLLKIDFICKLENIKNDIDRLCEGIGLDRERGGRIQRINKAELQERNVLPENLLKKLMLFYAIDFDYFGYSTDYGKYAL
ncbi:MAG: hypothetical protein EOM25_07565 [Deltaproteobacteria bacterium]|nr:hypothetical protein [Deltaproteobacteria bacterium]